MEAGQLAADDAELSAGLRCLTAWEDDHTAVETLLQGLQVEDEGGLCSEEVEWATQVRSCLQHSPLCSSVIPLLAVMRQREVREWEGVEM